MERISHMMMDQLGEFLIKLIFGKLDSIGISFGDTLLILGMFGLYKYTFSPLKKSVTEIRDNFGDLHNAALEMQHFLKTKMGENMNPMHILDKLKWANANSPFELNDEGTELALKSGIQEITTSHIDDLIRALEKIKPSTGYDVEIASTKVIHDYLLSDQDANQVIKNFLFNNPVFKGKETSLSDIYFVASIQLRNEYLKKYPEIEGKTTEKLF